MAPLLDPYKYLIGKYNIVDPNIFNLPKFDSTESNTNDKILDINNSAYVDGFFLFLTSNLIYTHNFSHGVDYYGSYLSIKNNFTINIFDDIDYLNNSDFFNKNKNILFNVDNYEHLFQNETTKLKPLLIDHQLSVKSNSSIKSINNEIFENIFDESNPDNTLDLNDLKDLSLELIDITNINNNNKEANKLTLKSNSTCSSRSSHTCNDDLEENCEECGESSDPKSEENSSKKESVDEESYSSSSFEEEEKINAIIPKFPVQIIGMEYCENTFDDLILNNILTTE
jgi:hypothetical protein